MLARTRVALKDAADAQEMHLARLNMKYTPPSRSWSVSPTPAQQSKKSSATLSLHKRAPSPSPIDLSAPQHCSKRPRLPSPSQEVRRPFTNPYEVPIDPSKDVEAEDITAEVEARLRLAEDRRKQRLDAEDRTHARNDTTAKEQEVAVEQIAGNKHRRSSGKNILQDGQDGGRYWLDLPPLSDSQDPTSSTKPHGADSTSMLRTRTDAITEPLNKRPRLTRPPLPPTQSRKSESRKIRDRMADVSSRAIIRELESSSRQKLRPGTKQYAMRRTADKAEENPLRDRVQGFLHGLEDLGQLGSGKVGGLEFGKRSDMDVEGWKPGREERKRRRVEGEFEKHPRDSKGTREE